MKREETEREARKTRKKKRKKKKREKKEKKRKLNIQKGELTMKRVEGARPCVGVEPRKSRGETDEQKGMKRRGMKREE